LLTGVEIPVLEASGHHGRGMENFIALISGNSNRFTSTGSTRYQLADFFRGQHLRISDVGKVGAALKEDVERVVTSTGCVQVSVSFAVFAAQFVPTGLPSIVPCGAD
jgi:hypothetical protein